MTDKKDWDKYLGSFEANNSGMVPLPRQNVVDEAILGELESAVNANNDKFQECYYGFLESALLPRMRDEKELTEVELKGLASDFKKKFIASHTDEDNSNLEKDGILLDTLAIISSLDLEFSVSKRSDETAKLVSKAALTLNQLMDSNFDELSLV